MSEKLLLLKFFMVKSEFAFLRLFTQDEYTIRVVNGVFYKLSTQPNVLEKITIAEIKIYLLDKWAFKLQNYLGKFNIIDKAAKESFLYAFQKIVDKVTFINNLIDNLDVYQHISQCQFNPNFV
ncbi:hypothetical protein CDIK_0835 [Cucumispora dikerogammari]|nr:hypothetical protein CDIK_0835 [Cucumispora dikerogammari]